ncbi:MAG: autotransporter outer membrane beta-barrel domain-containing protein [Alphaproteobacteria bacterium]|nr:autotransporter outer membrane beta-barrel domain-containing protein [Alphaproteobacteria bacterium]
MKLSRTALKELLKRYRCFLIKSIFCGMYISLIGFSSFAYSEEQKAVLGGTMQEPVSVQNNFPKYRLFSNGVFEMYMDLEADSENDTGPVEFQNAWVNVDGYGFAYENITYSFDDASVLDIRFEDNKGEQRVQFKNITGEGASLAFYITNNGSDKFIATDTSYLFDFDPLLISVDTNISKDKFQPLDGKAEFRSAFEGKEVYAASTNGYASITKVVRNESSNVSSPLQSVEFTYKGQTDDSTLLSLNQYQGDSLFFHDKQADYNLSSDLGTTGAGNKIIKGLETNATPTSTILANGNNLFDLKSQQEDSKTSLLIKDLIIKDAKTVIKSAANSGTVELNNVQILGQNSGLIQNGDVLIAKNSILKDVVNTGQATLINTDIQGTLSIDDGYVSLLATNENDEVKISGLTTVSSSLKLDGKGSIALNGLVLNEGAILDIPDDFELNTDIVSKGMLLGERVKNRFKVAKFEIAENSVFDVKTLDVTVKELVLGENSTLKVTLNGLSDYGKITGEKLEAQNGSSIKFDLGDNFETGVYQIFSMDEIVSLPLIMNSNGEYTFIDLKNGSYSFELKKTENKPVLFEGDLNKVGAFVALKSGEGNNLSFNKMQRELLSGLNSGNRATVKKATKALDVVGLNSATMAQSVAVEQVGTLMSAINLNIQGKSETIGHSGGDETARASVWTKAFYSQTKDTSHSDYKINGAGGVLGVQTKANEALTLGLGYAYSYGDIYQDGRETTIHNNTAFGYLRYQPSNWFVDGLFLYTRGEYEEEKTILSSKGTATYNVDSLAVQGIVGYDISYRNTLLTLKTGLRYIKVNQESYTDTFGTNVGNVSTDYITVLAGLDIAMPYKAVKGFNVRPTAGILFGYDAKTDDMQGVNTLANGTTYLVEGEALSRFSATINAGLETELNEKTTLSLEYSGSFRKSYQDHGGFLKLRYNF